MAAINPYEAPATSLANPSEPEVSAGRRSRWVLLRWLPLAYCGCLTGACLFFGGLQLFLLAQLLVFGGRPITPRWSDQLIVGLAFPLAFGLSALGVRTVQHWYRCRWKLALLTTLIFFILAAMGDGIMQYFMPTRPAPKVAKLQGQVQP